jgi:hypothetical protein
LGGSQHASASQLITQHRYELTVMMTFHGLRGGCAQRVKDCRDEGQ